MSLDLRGIEIENFKSYTEKQAIRFSDLSVFLGANSSGKSTALQALLAIKQTMECNSPDEDLLLSGKYVALGDFDDVISSNKEKFSFTAILNQTGLTENMLADDIFSISWTFRKGDDGISAILDCLVIKYENVCLEFRRDKHSSHILYINDERSPYSATINNLLISEYYIHYDESLNSKGAALLNVLLEVLVGGKYTKTPTDKPIAIAEIDEFFFKLLDAIKSNPIEINASEKENKFAERVYNLINKYGNALVPRYEVISSNLPRDLLVQLLQVAIARNHATDILEERIADYEAFMSQYESVKHSYDDFLSRSKLGPNPFFRFDRYEKKEDNLTQLKYALDFYRDFHTNIISKMFFVGPIRENPQGLYNIGFESIPKYVGPTGSYFASVLLHENKRIKEYILPHGMDKCTLSEALAEWLVYLNIASSVSVDKKNSFGFSVSIENMEQVKSDIMNVGIGTSQVLPVLISVLLSEPEEILIFEQPELHLHPYSQSRLADMFVEFCMHRRKVILETHSEYFLLRLRYHIVKGKYPKDAAAINFFHYEAGTKVENANISGFGNIEYPIDFHDETQELLNEIFEATLERKGLS